MEEDQPSRPSSVVHAPTRPASSQRPQNPRSQSTRDSRASRRDSNHPSPYPSRAPTPSEAPQDTGEYTISDPQLQAMAFMLNALPPAFAPPFPPSEDAIRDFSHGEMVIIPMLCGIISALSARPTQQAPTNLGPLEASVAALSARLHPQPPPRSFAAVAAQGSSASAPPAQAKEPKKKLKNLKGKDRSPPTTTPDEVAVAVAEKPRSKGPSTLPTTIRRMFAPRNTPFPHPASQHIIRSLPDIAANALREANCPFPLSFTALCNRKGSVTLLSNSPFVPASSYSPYFDLLTTRLNQAFPIGDNPFLPFRLAPSETQLIIHSVPTVVLPLEREDLHQVMLMAIRNSCKVSILDTRFLQPDPEVRSRGSATSIVVVVTPEDASKLGTRIRIFSKSCTVCPAHSSSKYSQCRKCLRFGHTQSACKAPSPSCPLCALHHTHSEHRCANPGCPKEGHLRPVPDCCLASPLKCASCGDNHAAYDRSCPARPRQPDFPQDDTMDTSVPPGPTTTPPPHPQTVEQTPRPDPPRRAFSSSSSSIPLSSLFGSTYNPSTMPPPAPQVLFGPRGTRSSFVPPRSEEELKNALFNLVPLRPPHPPPHVDDQ